MDTINISLPSRLKSEADDLIKKGYFASFSDLVRTALRNALAESRYDVWKKEAIAEFKAGKAIVLKTKKDIDNYFRSKME